MTWWERVGKRLKEWRKLGYLPLREWEYNLTLLGLLLVLLAYTVLLGWVNLIQLGEAIAFVLVSAIALVTWKILQVRWGFTPIRDDKPSIDYNRLGLTIAEAIVVALDERDKHKETKSSS